MKLYYNPASTTSRIVSFFLFDHDIAFDETIVTPGADNENALALKRLNPSNHVPVLVDDGFTLTESAAIIRYLAEKHQLDAYPSSLEARTRVDEAVSWFQTNFHVFHCVMLGYTHLLPALKALDPAVLRAMRYIGAQGSQRYLAVLNDHMIGSNPYVCGARITLADYVGAANVTLGYFAGVDLAPYPNVVRWLKALAARKGWAPAYSVFEVQVTSTPGGALSHAA
jgi:glutathione S-transferase